MTKRDVLPLHHVTHHVTHHELLDFLFLLALAVRIDAWESTDSKMECFGCFDLKSSREVPSIRNYRSPTPTFGKDNIPRFTLEAGDPQWDHWRVWLVNKARQDLATQMDQAASIEVYGSRWPKPESPNPKIPRRMADTISSRLTGDGA